MQQTSVKRADRAALDDRGAERTRSSATKRASRCCWRSSRSAALLFYYVKQQLLLYGDAVAHLNIARRVVDNRHPIESYGQLGTVWLPLQHIAMLPFVWVNALWQSGIAGAIPGMLAFVLGDAGHLSPGECAGGTGRSLSRRRHLCSQSEPALHADHGDERADLSGVLHLVAGLSRRVSARHIPSTGGFASTVGAAQSAALAGVLRHHDVCRRAHPLRRLVFGCDSGLFAGVALHSMVSAHR